MWLWPKLMVKLTWVLALTLPIRALGVSSARTMMHEAVESLERRCVAMPQEPLNSDRGAQCRGVLAVHLARRIV